MELNEQQKELLKIILEEQLYLKVSNTTKVIINQIISKLENNEK